MELLELDPDLRHEIDLETAPLRYCEQKLSSMLEDGIPSRPDPLTDLKLCARVTLGVYMQAVCDEAPEDRLQMVRDWLDTIMELNKDAASQQVQAIYGGAAPPAPPGAPPPAPPGMGNGAPPNGPTPQLNPGAV